MSEIRHTSSTLFAHVYETSEVEPLADTNEIGFGVRGSLAEFTIWMTPQVAWKVVEILQRQIAEAALRPEPATQTADPVEPEVAF